MFQRVPFLLALLALLSVGCTPRGSRGGRGTTTDDDDTTSGDDDDLFADDDDTAVSDDDDTAVGDDDDTAVSDDDDTVVSDDDDTAPGFDFNQIQFSFTVDASAPDASGNHDLSAVFLFSYVVADQAAGTSDLTCNQLIEVEGTGTYGFGQVPNCSNCTGLMTFDPSTAVDVSDPTTTDECDPQFLLDNGVSLGMAMLHPFGSSPGYWPTADGGEQNFGDFLNIATMDSDTQQSLGWDGSATGQVDLTAAGNTDWATSTYGLVYTHAGLVDGSSGANTLAAQSGIDGVSNAAGPGSDYYFYFTIAKDPTANSYVGQDMQGAYLGFARFVITFGT